jgi:hypothetical protein
MPADTVLTVTLTELIAGSTTSRIVGNAFDSRSDLRHVDLSLTDVPSLSGEVPDRREVSTRGG